MAFYRAGQSRRAPTVENYTLVTSGVNSYTATEDGLYMFVYHYLNGANDSSEVDDVNNRHKWIKVNDVEIPSLFYSATSKISVASRDYAKTFTGYAIQQLSRGDVVTTYAETMGVIKVQ